MPKPLTLRYIRWKARRDAAWAHRLDKYDDDVKFLLDEREEIRKLIVEGRFISEAQRQRFEQIPNLVAKAREILVDVAETCLSGDGSQARGERAETKLEKWWRECQEVS